MTDKERIFKGERIFIRWMDEKDVIERYLSWFRDEKVIQFLGARDLTYEEVVKYIQWGRETQIHYMYAICLNESGLHIGNLKVGPIDRKNMISDLVVVIGDTNYWGKGIATEAISLGNKIAFEVHKIRKLTGGMYSDNLGAIKCYTKAGWVEEARLKGHYLLNGKVLDRVCVSCFNPKVFPSSPREQCGPLEGSSSDDRGEPV